jgi:hypothetical protein
MPSGGFKERPHAHEPATRRQRILHNRAHLLVLVSQPPQPRHRLFDLVVAQRPRERLDLEQPEQKQQRDHPQHEDVARLDRQRGRRCSSQYRAARARVRGALEHLQQRHHICRGALCQLEQVVIREHVSENKTKCK